MADADFTPQATLEDRLNTLCMEAWNVHNILAFMEEAVPEDARDSLPVHGAVMFLKDMVYSLASKLGDEAFKLGRLQRQSNSSAS